MAKKITKVTKLQIKGGAATPAPPVGTALGPAGVNIGEFVKKFNDATQDKKGEIVPVLMNVYEDRTFDFILKTAPASQMILKAIGQEKGSGTNLTKKVGKITEAQIRVIAEKKLAELNANDIDAAMGIIKGTCRSMGVEVTK
ncbi:MAG: 50S ribosomal protein L11 [Syntrophales bacterium]|nr:50S ribosomal protein L11 [Syntrophales bacterium]